MIKRFFHSLLKLFIWSAFGILAFFIIALFIVYYFRGGVEFWGWDFDKKIWSASLDCTGLSDTQCSIKQAKCLRGPMFRDLEKNYLFIGTAKARVNELLGEGVKYHLNKECSDYPLGFCSSLQIDMDYLSVCYDDNNKIKRVYHYQG